ncbi:MAG: septum formation initiator family protein [Alistipes sp.]|jgi:cell division protein FtsB|nr:septum formation initiator family protein [Alistipes sp.]
MRRRAGEGVRGEGQSGEELREGGGKSGWFARVNGPSRALALAALLVLLALFGRDVLASWSVRGEIARLKERKRELLRTLAADSVMLKRLDDPEFLERYARENYLMRRAGDEVYIIIEN